MTPPTAAADTERTPSLGPTPRSLACPSHSHPHIHMAAMASLPASLRPVPLASRVSYRRLDRRLDPRPTSAQTQSDHCFVGLRDVRAQLK